MFREIPEYSRFSRFVATQEVLACPKRIQRFAINGAEISRK